MKSVENVNARNGLVHPCSDAAHARSARLVLLVRKTRRVTDIPGALTLLQVSSHHGHRGDYRQASENSREAPSDPSMGSSKQAINLVSTKVASENDAVIAGPTNVVCCDPNQPMPALLSAALILPWVLYSQRSTLRTD